MPATLKLLCVVRDSAHAFGPLKSVAGDLCSILENCEVWLLSSSLNSHCSWFVLEDRGGYTSHRITGAPDQSTL